MFNKAIIALILATLFSSSAFADSFKIKEIFNELKSEAGTYHLTFRYVDEATNKEIHQIDLNAVNTTSQTIVSLDSLNLETGEGELVSYVFPKIELKTLSLDKGAQSVIFHAGNTELPGTLIIHGSGGGVYPRAFARAFFMAQNGYVAQAYCYFNCPFKGSSPSLYKIDIKKVYDAMGFLREYTDGNKVGFIGASRGAEQVALLASYIGEQDLIPADAYVADRPAPLVVPAHFYHYDDPDNWLNGEAWKYPFEDYWIGDLDGPHIVKQSWLWGEDDEFPVGDPNAGDINFIKIEKVNAPYMNIHGVADEIWPVQFSNILKDRLEENGIVVGAEYLFEDKATVSNISSDHMFRFYYFDKEPHGFYDWGQKMRAQKMLDFLDEFLKD